MLSNVGRTASGGATAIRDERLAEDELAQGRDRNAVDLYGQQSRNQQFGDDFGLRRANTDINQRQFHDEFGLNRAGMDINQRQFKNRFGLDRSKFLSDAAMERAKLGIEAPMARTKQAAYGDALNNVHDVNIDFTPKTGSLPSFDYSGGLRPSLYGDHARAAGNELARQALLALMTKSDIPAMPDVAEASDLVNLPEASGLVELPTATGAPTAPTLSGPHGSGVLENTLGGVGLGASILGALGKALKRRKVAQMPVTYGPYDDDEEYV